MTNESTRCNAGTPSDRKLDLKSFRRDKAVKLRSVFVGLALSSHGKDNYEDEFEYAVVVHNGMGVIETERDTRKGWPDIVDHIIRRAREYARAKGYKIQLLAVAGPLPYPLGPPDERNLSSIKASPDTRASPSLPGRVWLELDAVPFYVAEKNVPHFSLEAEAVWAVEQALPALHPIAASSIKVTTDAKTNEVQVDANGLIHLYDLSQQAALTSPGLWHTFTSLASMLQKQKTRVSFFSATPQGGGVALMRHALIRVWRMAGLDFHWYIPQGDSSVFDITKRKFHNVLQGVAPLNVHLTDENKELFERWNKYNVESYWTTNGEKAEEDSPFKADIVVIDDPQLTAVIPYIRKLSPKTKIIYRSHIEVRSDLVNAGKSPQADTWNYLFNFIKQADLFVSHPVEAFVPECVHRSLPVLYMPPSTDPLDGLNKPMTEEDLAVYRNQFAELVEAECGIQVDWKRGYILQVARFDPSKGIPDLVEGYRVFRKQWKERGMSDDGPLLVITGQGSVDDPDGSHVLRQLHDTLESEPFADIRDDIFAIRSPPCDRLLNALMRATDIAAQVSMREGFEIKVTEAIHKGRWIIATKTGGIPLQIRDGVDGTLVHTGDAKAIAEELTEFYASGTARRTALAARDRNSIEEPVGGRWESEGDGPREELFTIGNATMWQYLFCKVLGLTKEQVDEIPAEYAQRLQKLGLGRGVTDLKELNGVKVWDEVKSGKN